MSQVAAGQAPDALLRRLEWQVVRRLVGRNQGAYRTNLRGSGVDVTDIRVYEPYDDVRHIDWNVTARLDEPHVREFTEDREVTAWMLVDRSSSMRFGPEGRGKDVVLVELAASLARVLTRGGNRVGAMLFDGAIHRSIPPGTSREHVLRLTSHLLEPAPPSTTETDLVPMLEAAAGILRRRSLVFVVSDMIVRAGWARPLAALGQRHEVVVLRIADRREYQLPAVGLIMVEDAETGEQLMVDTSDMQFRAAYERAALDRHRELERAVMGAGAALHTVWTDEDLVGAIVRMTAKPRRHR